MNKILHHYNTDHLPISAQEVVPIIINKLFPNSVVDVGCGLAQWLKVFQNHGVKEVLGIDGDHVPMEQIYIEQSDFLSFNLEKGNEFKLDKKYDLAVSLEVAEHISEDGADGFVHMLTQLSDRILFSAAIPNQTGENHLNEQPHDYWQKKFRIEGYEMLDSLRPLIWHNSNINWWYRQNCFLLVKKEDSLYDESLVFDGRQIIHPELLNMYANMVKRSENSPAKKDLTLVEKLKKIIK